MTITTRPADALEGTRVVVEGGEVRKISPAGCPAGTTVQVDDLFYNVPARKKFLRARQTETSRIFEVCQRIALSHPELRLMVRSDGRQARRYLPAASLIERARQVFGDVPLQEIHAQRDTVALDAALAPPELARAGARHLCLLINGRPIADRGLARAIAFAYGSRMPPGHYPRGVVSLRLPPEDVDVNAHPQKTEVRFRRAAHLVDLVTRMVAARLPAVPAGDAYWAERMGALGPGRADGERTGQGVVAQTQSRYETTGPNGLRFVAQLRDRVLVCESKRELLVLDREQADALVRYESLREAAERNAVTCHQLLFPDRLELEPSTEATLAQHHDLLRSLGFDWSQLGPQTYVIRAVPKPVADAQPEALLKSLLRVLERAPSDALDVALRALARGGATPNGQVLDEQVARRLTAGIWPDRPGHRACILARIPLPSSNAQGPEAADA